MNAPRGLSGTSADIDTDITADFTVADAALVELLSATLDTEVAALLEATIEHRAFRHRMDHFRVGSEKMPATVVPWRGEDRDVWHVDATFADAEMRFAAAVEIVGKWATWASDDARSDDARRVLGAVADDAKRLTETFAVTTVAEHEERVREAAYQAVMAADAPARSG